MSRFFIFLFIFVIGLSNIHAENITNATQEQNQTVLEDDYIKNKLLKAEEIKIKIDEIDKLNKNSIWVTRHENFLKYEELNKQLLDLENELKLVMYDTKDKSAVQKTEDLLMQKRTIMKKLEPLNEFKDSPFSGLLKTPAIPEIPKITNPFAIANGFSYIKKLKQDSENYNKLIADLETLISRLKTKNTLIEQLSNIIYDETVLSEEINVRRAINEFNSAYDIISTSYSVYIAKIEELTAEAKEEIKNQVKSTISIVAVILAIVLVSFLFKIILKKYMPNSENSYILNKVINIFNVSLIIIVLLVAYIDNMTYLIAILGVASAGIAIAMKDMFMNMFGWMVIVFGGSFSVGDRIRVRKDGSTYVGDIVDISLMRMTIFEEVTLTTYFEDKRAGRIIFVPNNYIFTTLIANYTHSSLKTIWDGIFITISFDSNHQKAMYIIKEIIKKYSQGYTDIAKKQFTKLRSQYNMRNSSVEPKMFMFIEPHGLMISTWYMTNSYAALSLRSAISADIIDAINKEHDIAIAYPTQTLNLKKAASVYKPKNMDDETEVVE